MDERIINAEQLWAFAQQMTEEERAPGTIEKYLRDAGAFADFAAGREVTKELVAAWKEHLLRKSYAPVTINSMLAAVHGFFDFMGWEGCKVKYLKVQRRLFRDTARELTRDDYERLTEAARSRGKERLALLMETICATGIRVSEVRYITVGAAQRGKTEVTLKGKIRTVLIPNKLCRKLQKYAKKNKIASGEIFLTRSGKSMTRRQIWGEMKALCKHTGIDPHKVFPHNLRHVFAKAFYRVSKDIAKLADILGHSSIETTRIYLISTGTEHTKQMEQLRLVT